MAVSLGQVGIVTKGYYQAGVTYQSGNFVFYKGSTYLCLKNNTQGVEPENDGVNWIYMAEGAGNITDTQVDRFENVNSNFPIPQAGETLSMLFGKIKKFFTDSTSKYNAIDSSIQILETGKQNTLVAGANINIDGSTISANVPSGQWTNVGSCAATGKYTLSKSIDGYNDILFALKESTSATNVYSYMTMIMPINIFKLGSAARAHFVTQKSSYVFEMLATYESDTEINVNALNTLIGVEFYVR